MKNPFKGHWGLVLGVALATIAATLVVINFLPGEKRIEQRLERLYPIEDQRFARELSVLLGPPLVGGNRVQVLRNGDEIFPPMLDAIHSARGSIISRGRRCSMR